MSARSPLSAEQRAALGAHLGDAKPARTDLVVSFGEIITNVREHDHPQWEDLYCLNLVSYMGEHMRPILRRLLDAESEAERYCIAWRRARTRALSTGSAADRYAARARELQTAVQDMFGASLATQMERDELRDRVAELEQQAATGRAEMLREEARRLRRLADEMPEPGRARQSEGLYRAALVLEERADEAGKDTRKGESTRPGADLEAENARLRAELERERRAHTATIGQRDTAVEAADALAYAVVPVDVIGEHSAGNCPWPWARDRVTPAVEVERLRARVAELEKQATTREAITAERDAQITAWLLKKAREYRATGSRDNQLRADGAEILASKIRRGAVRPENLGEPTGAVSPWQRAVDGLNALVDAEVGFWMGADGMIYDPFGVEYIKWDRDSQRWRLLRDEPDGINGGAA
ncbi:coiled-coil domain-containing protein [Streptomyces rimosus]|uniref:hypothetical protein n=1 Tax=Streptomyces rimosus TaxID=1927 RepID=UPI0004BF7938|nr:hypothetical protein [Streptomyces rimosus]